LPTLRDLNQIHVSNSTGHASTISRRMAPELLRSDMPSKSERAQGMPGEGLTHGPPATKKQAAVTTGVAEHPAFPAR
jgi:hypothetical protein